MLLKLQQYNRLVHGSQTELGGVSVTLSRATASKRFVEPVEICLLKCIEITTRVSVAEGEGWPDDTS